MPKKVAAAYARLKREYKGYISLNKVNGRYYIYRQTSTYVKGENNSKTVSEYLGKITEDGVFLRKVVTKEDELKNAMAIIRASTGKTVTETEQDASEAPATQAPEVLDEDDKKILMALSMNGRIEVPYMKKIMSIGKTDINYRIQRLEKRFEMQYLAVIEPDKLGYEEYVAFVRFKGKKPGMEEIARTLGSEPHIQLAILTNGAYDVVMHLLVEKDWASRLDFLQNLEQHAFPDFDVEWAFSPFLRTYGYVPLRGKFFEGVLKNKIWRRSRGQPRPEEGQITQREYAVLSALSTEGKESFSSIDERYGFERGRAQYTYHQLKVDKKINRITVSLQNLPIKYLGILQMTFTNATKFKKDRPALLQEIVAETIGITNRYSLIGDIAAPYGVLFVVPVTDDAAFEELTDTLQEIEGTSTTILIGRRVAIGSVCYRRYDNSQHPTWEALEKEYKIKPARKGIDYDGSSGAVRVKHDIRGLPMN